MNDQIQWVLFAIPSILIASTVHECAHAWTAYKLGDVTAKANGRLTLNPLAHIDPVGALMMIIARFGWSKPVPINEYNFKNPVIGTAISSFAGPASNLALAFIASLILRLIPYSGDITGLSVQSTFVLTVFVTFILVNLSLAIFNLLPVPPLDGHKIVRAFLPKQLRYYWESLERYGLWILVLLFLPFSPLYLIMTRVLSFSLDTMLRLLLGS
jgi:Zn-dependent protease